MTYPEAQEVLILARTTLQGVNARITTLTSDVTSAVSQQDALFSQIPPVPLGGYTEDAPADFEAQVNAWGELAISLDGRITS